jgi:hypothetical protein
VKRGKTSHDIDDYEEKIQEEWEENECTICVLG